MNAPGPFMPYRTTDTSDRGAAVAPLLQARDFLLLQWRLIALVTSLAITVGIANLALQPSRFTASADMIIDTKKIVWMQSEMATENRVVDDASVESEIETTMSENVTGSVARRLHLNEDPEFIGTGASLRLRLLALLKIKSPPARELSSEERMQGVMAVLRGNLRVTRVGRSYIERISYTSLDPIKAATIANAFADAYIEDQLNAKFEATHRASVWLEERIGELRKQATNAYQAVQDFKSQNSIIIGVDGKLASEVELDQLGVALAKARTDTSQAKAKFERVERVLEQRPASNSDENDRLKIPDPIVTDALNNPVITKLRQQFLDDQSKESEWSSRYGRDHQAARNLRAEMAALQRAIWDEIARIAESYKSELQIAKAQEDSIDKRIAEVFQKSGTTRQAQVRLRDLETASNTYRNVYETFLSRFTQSVQQQSFPSTEARVVTPATPPHARSSPKTSLTLTLAGLCGIGIGVMLAFAREQMNRQIHTRAQIEDLLGTSCLAVLPAFAEKSRLGWRAGAGESGIIDQISDLAPFSATAEALRYIKVAIDLHPSGGKVIGIVSALPGEGKTTLTTGFAAFVAKNGSRTLVIDADLRNPSMTKKLGYADSSGLLDMVAEGTSMNELLIKESRFKFDFLPAASTRIRPSNSSDILNSPAMRQALKTAKGEYDYVLVDLPPILPVVDVQAVAHLFDAFVLVVEWGSTKRDEIVQAVAASPILAERLLGTVLNKADENVMRRIEGYSDRRYGYYNDEKMPAQSS